MDKDEHVDADAGVVVDVAVDVVVVGAGAAGSAAAMQLGRVRRSVVVVDAGAPRNAPAAYMHGYLGHDGRPPADFARLAHKELVAYGIDVTAGRVESVVEVDDRLRCTLDNGDHYLARRIVLASGLRDMLPDIDGVAELWGDRVIHCPWCHGWEVRDQRIAVIDSTGVGRHQALIFAQLSDKVLLIGNHQPNLTADEVERLRFGGVGVETRAAVAVTNSHDAAGKAELRAVLADGETIDVDVVVVGPRFEPNAEMVDGLVAVTEHVSGLGHHVRVDQSGATSHRRIFAAGNVADPMQQVLHAAAHGSQVAVAVNSALVEDDIETARTAGRSC